MANLQEIPAQVITSVPFVMPSSGTMGNNGAITLTTALPTTYSAGCFIYLPASAIFAGSAAGWYWAVFSSATVGTVYNFTYTSGQPLPPSAATPLSSLGFISTGPGAYTQVLTAQTGPSIQINPNLMGNSAFARFTEAFSFANTANNKTVTVALGGQTVFSQTALSQAGIVATQVLFNRGGMAPGVLGQNQNILSSNAANPFVAAALVQATIPFGTQTPASMPSLTVSLQLAAATDFAILEGIAAEFVYGV